MQHIKMIVGSAIILMISVGSTSAFNMPDPCQPDCRKAISILKRGHNMAVVQKRLCPKSPVRVDFTSTGAVCLKCKGKKGEIGVFPKTEARKRIVKYGCDEPE